MKRKHLFLGSLLLGGFASCNNIPANTSVPTAQERTSNARKDSLFAKEGYAVLREIDTMIAADQTIRNYLEWGTADTLEIAKLEAAYRAQGHLSNTNRRDGLDVSGLTAVEKDSVWNVIKFLQTKHTKRMIALISRYGYPNSKRFGEPEYGGTDPFILLHHPDTRFKDTLASLLYQEVRAGRQDSASVAIIEWDLKGREGLPAKLPEGVQIIIKQKPRNLPAYTKKRDTTRNKR